MTRPDTDVGTSLHVLAGISNVGIPLEEVGQSDAIRPAKRHALITRFDLVKLVTIVYHAGLCGRGCSDGR